ncbi:MAG: hypothetical protein E7589_01335 [Ruminococcaceae bacterium]|nr:hypothetical protein [Oscillospiraceae bacterium]
MSNYIDADVRCPFYKKALPKEKKLKCEGVCEKCSTHLVFSSRAELERFTRTYCCARYWDCGLFWALKEKYPGD